MTLESKQNSTTTVVQAQIWNPVFSERDGEPKVEQISDGALAFDTRGRILELGPVESIKGKFKGAKTLNFPSHVLIPGFIDCHLHMPQLDMMGAYGKDLLSWLNHYTFPFEQRFNDNPSLCESTAKRLCQLLLKNGITTAGIYTSSALASAHAMFAAANDCGLRAIIGKVSMDRHAPTQLLHAVAEEKDHLLELIERWHQKTPRLFLALTPRFAPSCSDELMCGLADLFEKTSGLYVQSHLSETREELAWVSDLYRHIPSINDYFAVYEHFGLVGKRTIFGHGIHLNNSEMKRLAHSNTALAHCPTSNAFLGSGTMNISELRKNKIKIGLASDIGAGTSLSPWQTMLEAYKLQRLQGKNLSPAYLFYLATLGGAESLGLQDQTGNFQPGKYADFSLINWQANHLLEERFSSTVSVEEKLFALITLGDDRLTDAVYIEGKRVL